MKIIITGATGSLGAFLTRYYSAQGHEVIATGRDRNPPARLLKYATYFCADITEPFRLPPADVCIHTAALSDDKASIKQLYKPNVLGSVHAAQASALCTKFLHISSSSVYLPKAGLITEELAGRQSHGSLSAYGRSKLLAEEKLLETTQHEACFILRPRALYGAGDRVILPRILKLVKNNVFNRPGKMEIAVSFTHYENMARALDLCIVSDKKGIHTYNVADEGMQVLVEVIRKLIVELYGHPLQEKEIGIWLLKLLAFFRIDGLTPLLVRSFTNDMVLDTTKIKNELNYRAVTTFDDKLSELGHWVKQLGGTEVIKTGKKELAWL